MSSDTTPCLNCGHEANLRFCPACGQRTGNVHLKFSTLFMQMVDAYLNVDGTLFRTLKTLFLYPGKLTTEYWAGRQVQFLRPFNLYVVSSFLFFISFATTTKPGQLGIHINLDAKSEAGDEAHQPKKTSVLDGGAKVAMSTADAGAIDEDDDLFQAFDEDIDSEDDDENDIPKPPRKKGFGFQPSKNPKSLNLGEQIMGVAMNRSKAIEKKHPEGVGAYMTNTVATSFPNAMFVLLPFFAFLLKFLYVRHDTLFSEHFIFSLHIHAFAFLLFAPSLLLQLEWLRPWEVLFFASYTLLAVKKVYAQGWVKTLVKTGILTFAYGLLVVISISIVAANAFANG